LEEAGGCEAERESAITLIGRGSSFSHDDRWPIVSEAGFISIVLPNFASADKPRNAWVGVMLCDGPGNA